MKRLLLILLVAMLPVQTSLAAMCAYCVHAESEGAAHVLSHGDAAVTPVELPADPESPASDPTGLCALCHLGSASFVTAHTLAVETSAPVVLPGHEPPQYDPSHCERIEHVPLAHAASF